MIWLFFKSLSNKSFQINSKFELTYERLPIPLVTYHSICSKHNFREESRKRNLQERCQVGSIGGLSPKCKATGCTLQGSNCGLLLQRKATTRNGKRINHAIIPLHFHKRRPAYQIQNATFLIVNKTGIKWRYQNRISEFF